MGFVEVLKDSSLVCSCKSFTYVWRTYCQCKTVATVREILDTNTKNSTTPRP